MFKKVVFDFAAGGFLEILEAPVVFAAGGPETLYLTLTQTHAKNDILKSLNFQEINL